MDQSVASVQNTRRTAAASERASVRTEKSDLDTEGEAFEEDCDDVVAEVQEYMGELFPNDLLDRLDRLANGELSGPDAERTRTELRVQIAETLLSTRERVQDKVRARTQEAFNKGHIFQPRDLVRYHSALEHEVASTLMDALEPGEEHLDGLMADLAFSQEAHGGLREAFRSLHQDADQREQRFNQAARASQRTTYDAQGNPLSSSGNGYMFEDLRSTSSQPSRSAVRGHRIPTTRSAGRPRG